MARIPLYWAAAVALLPLALSLWLAWQVTSLQRTVDSIAADKKQVWTDAEVATEIMGRGIQVGLAGSAHVDGTENAPSAWGNIYYIPNQAESVLTVGGLPSLPGDKCYQVWLIRNETWMNGGTFYLQGDGRGMLIVKSPMPMDSIDTVRVTMEPHGGSPEPRGNRYMWARLKSS
jgi:hypothetical protein